MRSPLDLLEMHGREIPVARTRLVGIYILVLDGDIVYVGQSRDIESRIALHRNHGTTDFDRAFWIEVPAEELDAYEGALIRGLSPRACCSAPRDKGRDAEILARFGIAPDPVRRAEFMKRRAARWPYRAKRNAQAARRRHRRARQLAGAAS